MELLKKQKRIGALFGIFLAFMFVCTLVSRALYASKLPQIEAQKPGRSAISHKVETEGIVQQGMEYAVNALSGLRCRTVYAHVGDRITKETVLFEIDLEDLDEQIAEQELAIQKLSLTIGDQQKNRSLEAEQKKTGQERAGEDYNRTKENAKDAVEQAKKNLKEAQEALEKEEQNPPSVTAEEEREKKRAEYEAWAKTEQELKDALAQAESEGDEAAYKTAEDKYNKHQAQAPAIPDYAGEDTAYAAWEAGKSALQSEITAAEHALEQARQSRDDALRDAERQLEDAGLPAAADSSLEINRLELSVMKEKLEKYKAVRQADGKVYPESEGIITRIQVSPGERVLDGAAAVYADLESPLRFHVTLTKEQKKYVNQGDTARLTFGNSGEKVTVDYVAESDAGPDLFEAEIVLPENTGTLGQSGIFTVETQSEIYNSCVPLEALYTDENGRNYVYVVREKSGILGAEFMAERIYVKVLDKNDSMAALEEGVIDSGSEVITDSTELLEDRMIIRYKE